MPDVVPLRWGVLGAARIAREQVIPAIRRSGAGEVLAVSSASGRARAFADELGVPNAHHRHEDLLADPEVDVAYVPLPNSEHASWVLRAVEAGKHVLCEKPLVLDPADAELIGAAAARRGVVVAEAFMYRHHAQQRAMHELLADGAIGELVAVHARLHFRLARTAEPDIRLRPELGGGALWDLGCYPVDLAVGLLGGAPDEVAATGARDGDADGVHTSVAAVLRRGRVTAGLDCSFDAEMTDTAELVGSRGTLTASHIFRPDRVGGVGTLQVRTEQGERVLTRETDQYAEQVRDLARQIRAGAPDPEPWARSLATASTLARIQTALTR